MLLQSKAFSPAQRWPSSVKLNYKEGVYTIDALKSEMDFAEKNILLWLVSIVHFISQANEDTDVFVSGYYS